MDERFWRLLGACELLAHEETAALTHRNLPALLRAQEVKSSILADLAAQAGLLNASCDSRARARLTHLLDTNLRNASSVATLMQEARGKKNELHAVGKQLRKLRSHYQRNQATSPTAPQPFSAHG